MIDRRRAGLCFARYPTPRFDPSPPVFYICLGMPDAPLEPVEAPAVGTRRILCLYLPHLATQRLRTAPSSATSQSGSWGMDFQSVTPHGPLVLTRCVGNTIRLECVCPLGQRLGLRPGMTLTEAQALAPNLTACEHDSLCDEQFLDDLAAWALRFSPLVQPLPPETLLIDITGCQRLFRGEHNLVRQALDGLRSHGLTARAAIADTIGAAFALATSGGREVVLVPEGQTSAYLASLPPAALRIEPQVVERLLEVGLRTIADLLMLPRSVLPARFGSQLVLRLQQALGEIYEPLIPYQPRQPSSAQLAFDSPVTDLAAIQSAAAGLLERVCDAVFARGEALHKLEVHVQREHRPPRLLEIALARPSRSTAHIGGLLAGKLERLDLSTGVAALRLIARETARWTGRQEELFDPGHSEVLNYGPSRAPHHDQEETSPAVAAAKRQQADPDEALATLIDRIADRLGHSAILRPRLVDDYQPELAWRYVPVAQAGLGGLHLSPGASTAAPPGLARPLQLLRQPLPIRVIALFPEGPPVWLRLDGREQQVLAAWGPERIETGWWRGPDVRRDYFRVLIESGGQLWVYHDRCTNRWHLHGRFC